MKNETHVAIKLDTHKKLKELSKIERLTMKEIVALLVDKVYLKKASSIHK